MQKLLLNEVLNRKRSKIIAIAFAFTALFVITPQWVPAQLRPGLVITVNDGDDEHDMLPGDGMLCRCRWTLHFAGSYRGDRCHNSNANHDVVLFNLPKPAAIDLTLGGVDSFQRRWISLGQAHGRLTVGVVFRRARQTSVFFMS